MEKRLQNLVFPVDEKHQVHWGLFYRGNRCVNDEKGHSLLLPTGNAIGFDWSYQPQVQSLRKQLLAVNVFDRTANLRKQDRAKFRELQKRYRKDIWSYALKHKKIEQKYREAKYYMISEEFWKKYLEL